MHYNPFHYIRSEKDILKLVNTIMVNTKGEGEKSNEDFWTKAERLLYCALIGYIWYEAPEEEQNFQLCWSLSMLLRQERKMKNLKMQSMNCLRNWKETIRTILQ